MGDLAKIEALFFALWTVKEAWLKRRREGVAPRRLAQLESHPDPEGELRTYGGPGWCLGVTTAAPRWWTQEPGSSQRWRVEDLAGA